MARPIIATDVAGCRDVVDDGENGFLCQARDAVDLAQKMIRMAGLSRERRLRMGEHGRSKMAAQFDEKIVIAKYLATIEQIEATQRNLVQRRPAYASGM